MASWNQKLFDKDLCQGAINFSGKSDIVIQGNLKGVAGPTKVFFWAAAPPTYNTGFSGSGMPYPDPSVAFDRTPNKGVVDTMDGRFTINMKYPNAYYIGLGSLYVPPHVNFKVCQQGVPDKYFSVEIDGGIPFRLLTWPAPPSKKPRTQAMFYYEPEKGARSQEAILRASAYPSVNAMPDNFWGERPPR